MSLVTSIDVSTYKNKLDEKTHNLSPLFKDFFNIDCISVTKSEPINYRMRAEFGVYLEDDNFQYFMVDQNGKTKNRVFINDFPVASVLINKTMPVLKELICKNKNLHQRLFAIEFLSSLSNELLISLIYHKKLDESWQIDGISLQKEINKQIEDAKIKIVGRARKQKIILSEDFIWEKLTVKEKELHYHQQENSFTQPNAKINEQMLSWVIDNTKDNKYDLLELYCGNGNFSIALAPYFDKILATEISKTSVQSAQLNIQRNQINNLKIARLSSEEFTIAANKEREFNRLKEQNINIDDYNFKTVLVDPPRAGLDIDTIKLISQFDNIVYISCNPNSLADNLKELCKTHEVKKINFFDQFPYTEHIETGVILKKKK